MELHAFMAKTEARNPETPMFPAFFLPLHEQFHVHHEAALKAKRTLRVVQQDVPIWTIQTLKLLQRTLVILPCFG